VAIAILFKASSRAKRFWDTAFALGFKSAPFVQGTNLGCIVEGTPRSVAVFAINIAYPPLRRPTPEGQSVLTRSRGPKQRGES